MDVVDVIAPPTAVQVVYAPTQVVEVITEGPRGAEGPVADLNVVLAAVDGAVEDYFVLHPKTYTYEQATPVFHIEFVHPLDHLPDARLIDSAGTVWIGETSYPAPNRVAIDYNVPLAGTVVLT